MKLIRSGFDGLEFAIKAQIPNKLERMLEKSKKMAGDNLHTGEIDVTIGGHWVTVRGAGARGGYAYSCREETTGDWFFKKPSKTDNWGIRFSASSQALVLYGLEGLRLRVKSFLKDLGINAPDEAYNLSRIDFAIDFLAPDFELAPNNFVVHSRLSRKSFDVINDVEVNGKSNRTTSVTIGKMPSRQVIIYDKRAEVMSKGKTEWWRIWELALEGQNAPALDRLDRSSSQIWRVELRAAKRHLKDAYDIQGWASLYEKLQEVFERMIEEIRYCAPSSDTNRARWLNHEIWNAAKGAVTSGLFDHIPTLTEPERVEIKRDQKIEKLKIQVLGLSISVAAIEGWSAYDVQDFLNRLAVELGQMARADESELTRRFIRARDKYRRFIG